MQDNFFTEKDSPLCYLGYSYLEDVISGKEITNIWVKSLCKKVKKDFSNEEYIFDEEWAEHFLSMMQNFEHVIGEWDHATLILEPWQCFVFMVVEGFYWKKNGKRKYKTLHLELARGNGKSFLCSVIGLIYLSLYKTVKGNKIYAVATKKEQSRIVLDSAREMARVNKSYLEHTGTEVFAHNIVHKESGSEFKALSSDDKTGDGLQPHLAVVDELHAHKTRGMFDVVDSAMSKRKDSLMAVISTAGFSLEGIGYSQSCYAKKVALGDIPDETFLAVIFTLDEDDDWRDESVYVKANPNMGVSVDPDTFASKAFKAKNNPADEVNFKVKHLNLWQNGASQYFNLKSWSKLGNKDRKLSDMVGKKCYVGVDLASKRDLTSFAYVFNEDGKFQIFVENFCPEKAILESKNVNYKSWASDGQIIQTNGNAINYQEIEDRMFANSKKYKILDAFYDPWNATEFSQQMSKQRVEMTEFRMNTGNLSEPMKRLDALILEEEVEHNGGDLLAWCLSNVVAKEDANENVFPRKDHEDMKIDPIIAIIMAIAGWVNEEQKKSVYEERDMIFI